MAAKTHEPGLLACVISPRPEVCELHAVARQRDILVAQQGSWVQRMQKALVQMNIQLTVVLSVVMGLTGALIIRAIVAGERDPKALARHRHSRVKASTEDIIKALTGNWREEHLFVLRQSLGMYGDIAHHLAECDNKLQAELANLGQKKIDLGKVLSAKTKRTVNRVRQVLKMAAMSLSRCDSALGAFYWRLCARMDKPSANTAVAHKRARKVYFMLTRGEEFVDQGQQRYGEQQLARSVAALKRRASTLGFVVTPMAAGDWKPSSEVLFLVSGYSHFLCLT
jgi:hypothetical protein